MQLQSVSSANSRWPSKDIQWDESSDTLDQPDIEVGFDLDPNVVPTLDQLAVQGMRTSHVRKRTKATQDVLLSS